MEVSEPSNSADVTSSDADFSFFTSEDVKPEDIVDGEIVDSAFDRDAFKSRIKTGYEQPPASTKPADDKAKTTPPKVDEWMDFFSRVLIRAATDFYIEAAFRDIDEEWLSEREVDRIKLAPSERDRIAKPLAELAYKSKFTRKHGRSIIALTGSIDSVIQLGMWVNRVNRIASKYRNLGLSNPAQPKRAQFVPRPMQSPTRAEEPGNVSSGPDTQSGNGRTKWRPNIGGEVQNPDYG